MIPADGLVKADFGLHRYLCHACGYLTIPLGHRAVTLARKIHTHRHLLGLVESPWQPKRWENRA